MPHYDLNNLLRMDYTLPLQTVNKIGRIILFPYFSVEGHKWRFPHRIWLYTADRRLWGERVRLTPGVDENRIFRIYLNEVFGRPDLPVNRFLPIRVKGPDYRVEGTNYLSWYGGVTIGRPIDNTRWVPGCHWKETITKIDRILAATGLPDKTDAGDDYDEGSNAFERLQPSPPRIASSDQKLAL